MHRISTQGALAPLNWFEISENDPCPPPHRYNVAAPARVTAQSFPPARSEPPRRALRAPTELCHKQQTNYQQLFQILSTPSTMAQPHQRGAMFQIFCFF